MLPTPLHDPAHAPQDPRSAGAPTASPLLALALIGDARTALLAHDARRAARALAQAQRALEPPAPPDDALLGTPPSAAEQRVLALLDSELSLGEIADQLFLSRNTVKSHVRRIYGRLGVRSRREAVAAARRAADGAPR